MDVIFRAHIHTYSSFHVLFRWRCTQPPKEMVHNKEKDRTYHTFTRQFSSSYAVKKPTRRSKARRSLLGFMVWNGSMAFLAVIRRRCYYDLCRGIRPREVTREVMRRRGDNYYCCLLMKWALFEAVAGLDQLECRRSFLERSQSRSSALHGTRIVRRDPCFTPKLVGKHPSMSPQQTNYLG